MSLLKSQEDLITGNQSMCERYKQCVAKGSGLKFSNPPYCLTSTQMESGEVMLASGDLIAAQVVHMLKKRKTGIAVKPKMARKARKRM